MSDNNTSYPSYYKKITDKNFTLETDECNSCNCWICEEQKLKRKNVQRANFQLPIIIGFEQ